MNRRSLLLGSAATLPAVLTLPSLLRGQGVVGGPVPLSPVLLSSAGLLFNKKYVKVHQGTFTRQDASDTQDMISTVQGHFNEVGFDASLKKATAGMSASSLSSASTISTAYNSLHASDSTITKSEVSSAVDLFSPPSALASQLASIKSNGINGGFTAANSMLSQGLHKLPVSYRGRPSANMVEAQFGAGSFCQNLNFEVGMLGTATFALALGCLEPEPFFVVICPAVAMMAQLAGFLGLIAFILC